MALDNFISTVWATQLLVSLRKNLVYAQTGVINRDYEGDIRQQGDTVKITGIGPVSVGNYTKNSDIGDPETLTDAQTALPIDQSKYFNFQIDDIDKAQQNPKVMEAAMTEAAYALADAMDQYVAGLFDSAVPLLNRIGSTASPVTDLSTSTKAYDYLVDLGVLLTDAKVPTAGRWVAVPPWYYGLLLKDNRFVGAGTPTTDAVLRNGVIGEAAGFKVLQSHNVPNTASAKYKITAGHPMATTVADQISSVEGYRPQKRFADAVKGLHLYGGKVIRPTAIAVLTANKPS